MTAPNVGASTLKCRIRRSGFGVTNKRGVIHRHGCAILKVKLYIRLLCCGPRTLAAKASARNSISAGSLICDRFGNAPVSARRGRHGDGRTQGPCSCPAGYSVIATGSQASGTDEAARGVFRFEVTQPLFFSFAAGKYAIARRDVPVPVLAYLLRPRKNTDRDLGGVSKIIDQPEQRVRPLSLPALRHRGSPCLLAPLGLQSMANFVCALFASSTPSQCSASEAPAAPT